jgi:hypothetical protein
VSTTAKTWRTKDGRELKISAMTDQHLLNAQRMCVEHGFIGSGTFHFYLTCTPPTADAALDCFERELDQVIRRRPLEALDWLEDEIKRRGLTTLCPREYEV